MVEPHPHNIGKDADHIIALNFLANRAHCGFSRA
jgi:hypothetical protein